MGRWQGRVASIAVALLLAASVCGLLLGVHIEAVAIPAAALIGLTIGTVAAGRAVRHARLARQLARTSRDGLLAGEPVRTVPGLGPMVAGLLRPEVYCGDDVPARLSPSEQQAVLLHERCHQQRRDPVRLVALEAVDRSLGRIPAVRRWANHAHARLEIRADAYALSNGATRPDLAAALLRLADAGAPVGAGFATVTQQRLEALLDERPPPARRRALRVVVLTAALVAVVLTTCAPTSGASHPELSFAGRCLAGQCAGS
jgi:hypothetical protein